MSRIKMFFLGIAVVILFASAVMYFTFPKKDYDVDFFISELSSSDNSKLYLKKKVWGLTGDNQIIVISDSKDREFSNDSTRNYFYPGLAPFFYKLDNDTLSIYTTKASTIPKKLKTTLKIVQYELDNPDMMGLIGNDNYKRRGLKTID